MYIVSENTKNCNIVSIYGRHLSPQCNEVYLHKLFYVYKKGEKNKTSADNLLNNVDLNSLLM